jgi:hypothetical protein
MSLIEGQESVLSETEAGQGDGESQKLVPVVESIRYRRRAQSAEKQVEALSEQLAEARSQASATAEELRSVKSEQELVRKLSQAGAVDLETALLLAKARAQAQEGADVDGVIEQLKREKQYLFGGQQVSCGAAKRTAGAKDRLQDGQAVLERAAKKAAVSGNRTDLQEYLRLRRNFV